jgi:HD-like signal output (HDOD) protein
MSAQFATTPSETLDKIVSRIDEIAVLPHVVYKVLELSATTDTAASALERAIVIDPGFSTRLLTLANSAFYGLPRRVTSIREAVTFLGFKQIRQLAMTVGFFDMFVGKNDRESLRRRAWWRHSIDTAVCCRYLAQQTRALPPDEAYTCGLLHFIGKPILDRFQPGGYDQVEALVASGASARAAEQAVFGCDHIVVAYAACQKWRMPETLLDGIDYDRADEEDVPKASAIVAVASAMAWSIVDGPSAAPIPDWALVHLSYTPDQADDLIERATEVLAAAQSLSF